MRDKENRVVAVDFGGYSFLPPSFFAFALKHGGCSNFAYQISSMLEYPPSPHVAALVSASCALAPYSSNDIGEQISLLSFLFLASRPPYKETELTVLRRRSEEAPVQASIIQSVHPLTRLCSPLSSLRPLLRFFRGTLALQSLREIQDHHSIR